MRPVIIIGAARSGTRFLRDLLGAAPGVATVPHDIGFVWRHGLEQVGHDELDPAALRTHNRAWIRSRVGHLARDGGAGPTTHLVEKSVPNSLRPGYVARVFPEAHLVHLVRDGRQVVESALRSWQAPMDLGRALRKLAVVPPRVLPAVVAEATGVGPRWARNAARTWGPRYEGIDRDRRQLQLVEVCAHQWARCVERGLTGLARLDQPVQHLDYDRLVADGTQIERLGRGLGLSSRQVDAIGRRWQVSATTGNLGKWEDGLDDRQRELVAPIVDPVNRRLGHGPVR